MLLSWCRRSVMVYVHHSEGCYSLLTVTLMPTITTVTRQKYQLRMTCCGSRRSVLSVPAPTPIPRVRHSGGLPFRGLGLELGLTLADLRNGGPESYYQAVYVDDFLEWFISVQLPQFQLLVPLSSIEYLCQVRARDWARVSVSVLAVVSYGGP